MKQEVKIGQTDYTVLIKVRDTAGAAKTALAYNSAGLDVGYTRVETDNDVVWTDGAPATQTLTGAHSDWGFVEVDATKAPGIYRLDIADGVFASGATSAVVSLVGTGLDSVDIEFVLVPEAPYDGVSVKSHATGAIVAASFAADAIDAAALKADAATEIADAVLGRNVSNTEAAAGVTSLTGVVLKAVGKVVDGGAGSFTIYKTNGSDAFATQTFTTDAAALPVKNTGVSS